MAAHLTFTSHFNQQVQKLLEKEVSIILELIKHYKCSGKNICFQDLSTLQKTPKSFIFLCVLVKGSQYAG